MHTLLKSQVQDSLHGERFDYKQNANTALNGLSPRLRQKLLAMHFTSFDWEKGGLKTPIKFLDRDSIEYSLNQAALHDKNEERMATLSLDNGIGLIDENDGGIYQFATQNCWHTSHYSKTMAAQAGSLRLYSLAYACLKKYSYFQTSRKISRYLREVLQTPYGAFRSEAGQVIVDIKQHRLNPRSGPQIKTHENGWAIEALASCYEFCKDDLSLSMALEAEHWLRQHRLLENGGYANHECSNRAFVLADNLAMARACLQLYRCTGSIEFLNSASATADFILNNFTHALAGFVSTSDDDIKMQSERQIDENICTSRFLNLLYYYTKESRYLSMAQHGLRYLGKPEIATSRMEEAGILLLDEELSNTPISLTLIGNKSDSKVCKLHQSALRSYGWYKVLHWHNDRV